VASAELLEMSIPEELRRITGGDVARLEAYPFEPEALDEFLEELGVAESANKPSEVLKRMLKAAQRAIKKGRHTIDRDIVREINSEGA
jgi:hypothetical protein